MSSASVPPLEPGDRARARRRALRRALAALLAALALACGAPARGTPDELPERLGTRAGKDHHGWVVAGIADIAVGGTAFFTGRQHERIGSGALSKLWTRSARIVRSRDERA